MSSDADPGEGWVFHAADPSDPSGSDASYGAMPFEVRLNQAQACGRSTGIEFNARRMVGTAPSSWPWYGDLSILTRIQVYRNGSLTSPDVVVYPWTGPGGNLRLTRAQLGCP